MTGFELAPPPENGKVVPVVLNRPVVQLLMSMNPRLTTGMSVPVGRTSPVETGGLAVFCQLMLPEKD